MRFIHLRREIATAACVAVVGFVLSCSSPAIAADTELNVYNWSDYIAKDTISNFEKESGIHVRYDNYDNDDTLHAKLLAGSSGFDIVVPSSNYMAREIQAGMLQARQVADP
jgi:putrescine transport system substrate-binding protein